MGISIGLSFTPRLSEEQHDNLIRTLNFNTFTLLSITSAFSDLADTFRRHCHYCAMQFGVFTIVSFIEKVPDKYHQCLVYPTGGKIDIPDCKETSLTSILQVYYELLKKKTNQTVKHFLEKFVETNKTEMNKASLTVLKFSGIESLIQAESSSFCLLPPKFDLNRETNNLTLKNSHIVLFHYTVEQPTAILTVFFCAEYSQPLMKPYIILHTILSNTSNLSDLWLLCFLAWICL